MDAETTRNGLNLQTSGYLTHDRWHLNINNIGDVDTVTSSEVPSGQGFKTSIEIRCRTADGSPAAGDDITISTRLEGQDLQMFKKGTSSAEKMTVSFWVKATKTGTHILEVDDNDNSRTIAKSYTIDNSNTWEKKVLTIDADTTGAFGNDNGASLRLFWWVGAGSNYTSGTLGTSWASTVNANRAVGQVNNADSTDNNWCITGVQLEVGEYTADTIPPFQHESYGDSLLRCFRYFERNHNFGVVQILGYSTQGIAFAVQKRTSPTLTFYSAASGAGTAGSLTEAEASGAAKVVTSSVVNISGLVRTLIASSGITNTTMRGSFDADAEL